MIKSPLQNDVSATFHTLGRWIIPLIALLALGLTWYRLHFGLDVTDESYYVGMVTRLMNGDRPYFTAWDLHLGSAILYAPLVYAYRAFTGGLEGILLFMRQAYFFYALCVGLGIALLLRKRIGSSFALLCGTAIAVFAPYSLYTFSYNNLSLTLLLLGGFLACAALDASGKQRLLLAALAGCAMALMAISYPQHALTAILLGGMLLFFAWKRRINPWKVFGAYAAAGMAVALAVGGYFITSAGGVGNILYVMQTVLASPYTRIGNESVAILERLATFQFFASDLLVIGLLAGSALGYAGAFLLRRRIASAYAARPRRFLKFTTLGLFVLVLGCFGLCLLTPYYNQKNPTLALNLLCFVLFYFTPLTAILVKISRAACLEMLGCVWLPAFASFLITLANASSGFLYRLYMLAPGGLLALVFLVMAYWERREEAGFEEVTGRAPGMAPLGVFVGVLGVFFASHFTYVYQDAPLTQLTQRIEHGIGRGLYTGAVRGVALQRLEEDIRRQTKPGEEVLIRDNLPYAYLLNNGHACTPSVCDFLVYSYGNKDDTVLQDYFRFTQTWPEKIIYVDSDGVDAFSSIDDPEFQFSAYVREKYRLEYANHAEKFGIRVYVRK